MVAPMVRRMKRTSAASAALVNGLVAISDEG
jgi:hypothetical protein